jgi:hypothetical protein
MYARCEKCCELCPSVSLVVSFDRAKRQWMNGSSRRISQQQYRSRLASRDELPHSSWAFAFWEIRQNDFVDREVEDERYGAQNAQEK